MNSFQKLYEQGRQEGLQAGRQEGLRTGEQRGKANTLRIQLQSRFGPLTEVQLARLESLEPTAVDEALLRIFTADTVEAVLR